MLVPFLTLGRDQVEGLFAPEGTEVFHGKVDQHGGFEIFSLIALVLCPRAFFQLYYTWKFLEIKQECTRLRGQTVGRVRPGAALFRRVGEAALPRNPPSSMGNRQIANASLGTKVRQKR